MKKILIAVVACAMACAVACVVLFGIFGITSTNLFAEGRLRGSGHLITKRIEAPDFTAIDASRAVKVVVTGELTDEIVIVADDNVMEKVLVDNRQGTLRVGIDRSVRRISNYSVTVRVPANGRISVLDASSAAKIVCEKALEADRFAIGASSAAVVEVALKALDCSIDVSSAGRVTAAMEVGSCSIDASSSAKVELSGMTDKCNAEISSAAKLDAGRFVAADCTVDASSGAAADVNCTGMLRASASSGARIVYGGGCEVFAERSSGGSVHSK